MVLRVGAQRERLTVGRYEYFFEAVPRDGGLARFFQNAGRGFRLLFLFGRRSLFVGLFSFRRGHNRGGLFLGGGFGDGRGGGLCRRCFGGRGYLCAAASFSLFLFVAIILAFNSFVKYPDCKDRHRQQEHARTKPQDACARARFLFGGLDAVGLLRALLDRVGRYLRFRLDVGLRRLAGLLFLPMFLVQHRFHGWQPCAVGGRLVGVVNHQVRDRFALADGQTFQHHGNLCAHKAIKMRLRALIYPRLHLGARQPLLRRAAHEKQGSCQP